MASLQPGVRDPNYLTFCTARTWMHRECSNTQKVEEQQLKCWSDTDDGEETQLWSQGRAEGRKPDSWKGWYPAVPFVPFAHNMALFPSLLFVAQVWSLLSSPLPSYLLHFTHLSLLCLFISSCFPQSFLLLLCPSMSAPPRPPWQAEKEAFALLGRLAASYTLSWSSLFLSMSLFTQTLHYR